MRKKDSKKFKKFVRIYKKLCLYIFYLNLIMKVFEKLFG